MSESHNSLLFATLEQCQKIRIPTLLSSGVSTSRHLPNRSHQASQTSKSSGFKDLMNRWFSESCCAPDISNPWNLTGCQIEGAPSFRCLQMRENLSYAPYHTFTFTLSHFQTFTFTLSHFQTFNFTLSRFHTFTLSHFHFQQVFTNARSASREPFLRAISVTM